MWLFGPSVEIVRMGAGLASLITGIALGALTHRIFRDRWLGSATFTVVPWLFIVGRIGFEPATLPAPLALFLLAWWNADQAQQRSRQLLMAVLASLSLSVALCGDLRQS